jgi:hypothetical protein
LDLPLTTDEQYARKNFETKPLASAQSVRPVSGQRAVKNQDKPFDRVASFRDDSPAAVEERHQSDFGVNASE